MIAAIYMGRRTLMAIRRIKNHGKWVWQARVAYRGLRRAASTLLGRGRA